MIEASSISDPQTSTDTRNVTFSAALAAGLTHYGWLDGRKTDRAGREVAPANPSQSPEKEPWFTTSGIFGPLFAGSSLSADLQLSLANRLQARMAAYGSPEYALTWKQWDMLSGPPICALRASAHRISGRDCGGWPTCSATKTTKNSKNPRKLKENGRQTALADAAWLAGWPTPKASEAEKDGRTPQGAMNEVNRNKGPSLSAMSHVSGWHTPRSSECTEKSETFVKRNADRGMHCFSGLGAEAQTAGWATCSSRDWKDTPGMATTGTNPDGSERKRLDQLPRQAGMALPSGGLAGMGNCEGYRLNPKFSLWLQGYPAEWACLGARAMQSCRR